MKFFIAVLTLIFSLTLPFPVYAQETSGGFTGGSVKIGWDNRACNSSLEGAIRYNSSGPAIEYCNGTSWAISSGGIGNSCDGGLFVGQITVGGTTYDLITQEADAPSTMAWGPTSETTGASSSVDGASNTAAIIGMGGTHDAADYCDGLTENGKSDWYLPAEQELLMINSLAVLIGNFSTGNYWSSREESANNARWAYASTNNAFYNNGGSDKTGLKEVRCARKVAAGTCSP